MLRPLLVRIPEVFADFHPAILESLGATAPKKMGAEYFLIQAPEEARSKFVQWRLPVDHAWPCNPRKMEGFIEKAAQALAAKFGTASPQAILIGRLDPADRYYKTLASNLRGRTLQVFPRAPSATAEEQSGDRRTLFCMVGKEGLYCGLRTPREANGFHPGGTKYISQGADDTISRAGAKAAEALHYLKMHRPEPAAGSHWLELGASPGGMTSELLKRGYRVTAVDRAALDPRLDRAQGLKFFRGDVSRFVPEKGAKYEAILCDMNGSPRDAISQIARLSVLLKAGGIVIFTLKTTGADSIPAIEILRKDVLAIAEKAGLSLLAETHLTYNRQEFTLFLQPAG